MQKLKAVFIAAGILFFIGAMSAAWFLTRQITPNDSFQTGNTAGNLNNKGLFCEQNGIVYFSNAYDHDVLYSMNADETNVKRLNDVSVSSINADPKRIYYSQTGSSNGNGLGFIRNTTGMYRCDLNGKNTFCYTQDAVGILALCGNDLYFQHYTAETGPYLDTTPIDAKQNSPVLYEMVSPASVIGNTIYYGGYNDDHFLYALDTGTNTASAVLEIELWNPIVFDGWVYYMDLRSGYQLHRCDLSTGEIQILSKDRLDFFNLYGDIIYYQKSSPVDPALKRINIDGTNEEIVRPGVYENVNITSQYAYFHEFDMPVPVYHQSTYGPVNPTMFRPTVTK